MVHNSNSRTKQESNAIKSKGEAARHHEIAVRYAWNGKREGKRRAYSRYDNQTLRELERFYEHCYGSGLPDNDGGRGRLYVAATFIVRVAEAPDQAVAAWARRWAPWCRADEVTEIVDRIFDEKPKYWTADQLARRIGLTDAVRTLLNIRCIGSIDVNKAARREREKEKDRRRKAAERLAAGMTPRAASKAKLKKWELMDPPMSRATWYRADCPEPTCKRCRDHAPGKTKIARPAREGQNLLQGRAHPCTETPA
jgi:hypothetical protein